MAWQGEHQLTSLALAFPESLAVDDGECQKHQDDDDQGAAGQCKKGCILWWYSRDSNLHQVCSGPTCKQPQSAGAKLRGLDLPFPAHPSSRAMTVLPPVGLRFCCAHITCPNPTSMGAPTLRLRGWCLLGAGNALPLQLPADPCLPVKPANRADGLSRAWPPPSSRRPGCAASCATHPIAERDS